MDANNTAAMRQALIQARSEICKFAKYQCDSLKWENSNIQANCGDVLCSWRGLCGAKTAINAALAAPPRNCDRFDSDYKMLHTAWFDWTGSPSGHNVDGTVNLTFAEWLLAPAPEGGNDGSK